MAPCYLQDKVWPSQPGIRCPSWSGILYLFSLSGFCSSHILTFFKLSVLCRRTNTSLPPGLCICFPYFLGWLAVRGSLILQDLAIVLPATSTKSFLTSRQDEDIPLGLASWLLRISSIDLMTVSWNHLFVFPLQFVSLLEDSDFDIRIFVLLVLNVVNV